MDSILSWISSHVWVVSIISVVSGALVTAFFAKRRDMMMKIADKKSACYAEYLKSLSDFSKIANSSDQETIREINRNHFLNKSLLVLYASDDVLGKLAICEKYGIQLGLTEGNERYLELIKAMKRDVEKPKIVRSWFVRMRKRRVAELDRNIADILIYYKTK